MTSQYSQAARQILAYLANHSHAKDTVEGITTWWLLGHRIEQSIVETQQALSELTESGLVLENETIGTPVHYQVNSKRIDEIRTIVSEEQKD